MPKAGILFFFFECKITQISYSKLQKLKKRVIPLFNMAILQLAIPENLTLIFLAL